MTTTIIATYENQSAINENGQAFTTQDDGSKVEAAQFELFTDDVGNCFVVEGTEWVPVHPWYALSHLDISLYQSSAGYTYDIAAGSATLITDLNDLEADILDWFPASISSLSEAGDETRSVWEEIKSNWTFPGFSTVGCTDGVSENE